LNSFVYEPDFFNFQFVGYRPKYMDPRTDSDISLVHEYIGPGKYQDRSGNFIL